MPFNLSDLSNPVLKLNEDYEVEGVNDAAGSLLDEWDGSNGSLPSPVVEHAEKAMEQEEQRELKREVDDEEYLLLVEPLPNQEMVLIEAVELSGVMKDDGYYRTMLQNCPDIFYQLDPDGYIQFINSNVSDLGYRSSMLIDQHITTMVHPEDEDIVRKKLVLTDGEQELDHSGDAQVKSLELRLDLHDDSDRFFEVRSTRLLNGEPDSEQLMGTVGVIREVTEKHNIREELEDKEERLRTMTENFDEVFWMFDGEFKEVLYVNDQCEEIYGISPEELEEDGRAFFDYIYPDHHPRVERAIQQLCNGEKVQLEYRVNKDEDFRRWVSVQGVPIFDDGSVKRIIGASREITEQKRYEKKLEEVRKKLKQQTYEDPLLKVPNRRLFSERFQEEWSRAQRECTPLSMLMVDIDHFKKYNDHYGHQQGDRCLQKIADVLQNQLKREMDFVGRYGGEEFVIILSNTDEEGLRVVGERLRKAVRDREIPHETSHISEYVTISLGGATVIPDPSTSREDFLNVVDKRLYEAKEKGRNQLRIEKRGGE